MAIVRIEPEQLDPEREAARLMEGRSDLGALVSFTGYCRDEGGELLALEIEHYPGMAEAEIGRIAADAERRWPLGGLVAVHRSGIVRPGEPIVVVAAAAAHRAAAFAAVDFVMDFLKTEAPFWKRERRREGAPMPATTEGWVDSKATDAAAVGRWDAEPVDGTAHG